MQTVFFMYNLRVEVLKSALYELTPRDPCPPSVGSGSSGSAVAGRLAEVAGWQVLVLEAGQPTPAEVSIPAFHSFLILNGSSMLWGYRSIPQRHALKNYRDQV